MMKIVRVLNQLFSRRDKKILGGLLLLSISVSIIETLSITAIMVFISVATNFESIFKNPYYSYVYKLLHCSFAWPICNDIGRCVNGVLFDARDV